MTTDTVTAYLKQHERGRGPNVPKGKPMSIRLEPQDRKLFEEFAKQHDTELGALFRAAAHYLIQETKGRSNTLDSAQH